MQALLQHDGVGDSCPYLVLRVMPFTACLVRQLCHARSLAYIYNT
jgi:hypothetical protein